MLEQQNERMWSDFRKNTLEAAGRMLDTGVPHLSLPGIIWGPWLTEDAGPSRPSELPVQQVWRICISKEDGVAGPGGILGEACGREPGGRR